MVAFLFFIIVFYLFIFILLGWPMCPEDPSALP